MSGRLPPIFCGHRNRMNAVSETEAQRCSGEATPKPKAILCVSAGYVLGTGVTVSAGRRTIHDFGGFPNELYEVQYLAPGCPALARRVQSLLVPLPVRSTIPGAASITAHGPCSGKSIPSLMCPWSNRASTKHSSRHSSSRSKRIAPLRNEGVLISGTGNSSTIFRRMPWAATSGNPAVGPPGSKPTRQTS